MAEIVVDDAIPGGSSGPEPSVTAPTTAGRQKRNAMVLTDDLTGKYLRVGSKLYRTSDDNTPVVKLERDRLRTSNLDALPDVMRIARANGWTAIRLHGGDQFKKAAFLAAAANGLSIENYIPTKKLAAEADRLRERRAKRVKLFNADDATLTTGATVTNSPDKVRLKARADRFLRQSHDQNARDPELSRGQTLIAQAIAIANARHFGDPRQAAKDVEAKRLEVAARIARGDPISAIKFRERTAAAPTPPQDVARDSAQRSR